MKKQWWKGLTILLIGYTIVAGLLADVPRLPILNETHSGAALPRAHVVGMMGLFTVSVVYSGEVPAEPLHRNDTYAIEFANSGMLLGVLGILTAVRCGPGFTWVRSGRAIPS